MNTNPMAPHRGHGPAQGPAIGLMATAGIGAAFQPWALS